MVLSALMEADMEISKLYRQRAVECERMAQRNPDDREELKEVARTWRRLADAVESLSAAAKTIH
jgi:hypothetical protein